MSHQNRTAEFFSLCQSLPGSSSSNNNNSSSSSTASISSGLSTGRYGTTTTTSTYHNNNSNNSATNELISFHETASHLSQKIHSTSTLLNQLTTLIHSRSGSLFVDDTSRVNSLVLRIKSNIESLNTELDAANETIERNRRRTNRQAGLEANNLVGQLRDEFITTTKGFKDILKVRSDRMKERSDRQNEVLNGAVAVAAGEETDDTVRLLGNKPRIYEDATAGLALTPSSSTPTATPNNYHHTRGGAFNNALHKGGTSSTLIGGGGSAHKKMDGPRLDLTSAILGQQQAKKQQLSNTGSSVMPGGESSMQLPRPYGGIRQRNNNTPNNSTIPTYSGSTSSIYSNNNNNNNNNSHNDSSSHLPVYSPLDLQRMEASSSQQQQLQLIPDQTYLRQRADAMSEVETNIVELGTIFNKLAVMVNEHEELVQRVEDNVDGAAENIGYSMEVLADTMENLKTNRALFLKVFMILAVFVVLFICFFA